MKEKSTPSEVPVSDDWFADQHKIDQALRDKENELRNAQKPQMPPSWASPNAWHNWEDAFAHWCDKTSWGEVIDAAAEVNGWDDQLENLRNAGALGIDTIDNERTL